MKQSILQSGAIGPVVSYMLNGKQVMRSRPKKVKQTAGMQKQSSNFGVASKVGSAIRANPGNLFSTKDGGRYARLTGAVSSWFGKVSPGLMPSGHVATLEDFVINTKKQMAEFFSSQLSVSPVGSQLEITTGDFAPTKTIHAPAGTTGLVIHCCSLAVDIQKGKCTGTGKSSFQVPYNDVVTESRSFQHAVAQEPGMLVICGIAIEYLKGNSSFPLAKKYELPAKFAYAYYTANIQP